ncbi:MAG TPA: YkgJ family cysteine cluster protein [Thermoanaerobaculia bacterium]|nr:YkgJ family cysteine cluster protein [Thermoanaerobaculia bacterium]
MADESYRRILEHADEFFASVLRDQPENLQCGRGCSFCCYGLFEIGAADIPILAEGLRLAHPARRKRIIRKAREIVTNGHPDLRESTPAEKEEFFRRTDSIPCPVLSDSGECMLYENRPLVCRTFGLPLRDGTRYIGDVCDLNFTGGTHADLQRAAWDLQWEDVLGPEDEYTIPEAILLAARILGFE